MIDKASSHKTLDMLIGAMGAERDSAARKRVEDLREYVVTLEARAEVSHKGENTTSAQTLPSM